MKGRGVQRDLSSGTSSLGPSGHWARRAALSEPGPRARRHHGRRGPRGRGGLDRAGARRRAPGRMQMRAAAGRPHGPHVQ